MASPRDFDFDGAQFTHVRERVTFEVPAASFDLKEDPGIRRLSDLVHYLAVGGPAVPEAPGFETVLAGLRESSKADDELLSLATPVVDACIAVTHGPQLGGDQRETTGVRRQGRCRRKTTAAVANSTIPIAASPAA